MARRRKYELMFAPETLQHLGKIEAKYHGLIQRTIDEQLTYTPQRVSRNRKPLDEPGPYGATWELRFGPQNRFRVFYEVSETTMEVHALAIGEKIRERLFIGEKEYTT